MKIFLQLNELKTSYSTLFVADLFVAWFCHLWIIEMMCHVLLSTLYNKSFWNMLQIEVILKFEEMCLESAKEFSALFAQVCL